MNADESEIKQLRRHKEYLEECGRQKHILIQKLRAEIVLLKAVVEAAYMSEKEWMKIDDGIAIRGGLVPPEFAMVSIALRKLESI